MARVCFLFNHDQTHQVAHSLPIAMAMAEQGMAEVVLAVTSDMLEQTVRSMARPMPDRLRIVRLGLHSTGARLLARMAEGVVPARKLLIYRDNLDFFRGLDALVVSEKTSLLLKTRYGLDRLRIVHTRHGAGDRAIGFGPESAQFDLVLVAGPKIARRLEQDAGVAPERIRIVGYSKFDLCKGNRAQLSFPDPARPIVLYNPHPSPRLSSWYGMGESVLEAFLHQDRFNFIFAPHVMMFERNWTATINPPAFRRMRKPGPRYAEAPHMHIDLGSAASNDMSYTNLADVYIGDVSSQVYEFLVSPRPCLHLNAHNVPWQGDPSYTHWRAGRVIAPGEDIIAAVENAIRTHNDYRPTQQALLADTFSVTDQPASLRAAHAIDAFLQDNSPMGGAAR